MLDCFLLMNLLGRIGDNKESCKETLPFVTEKKELLEIQNINTYGTKKFQVILIFTTQESYAPGT